jgi:hypothetical protein
MQILDLSINVRNLLGRTDLEAGGAPVDELDGALGLDGGDGGVHVLGHHVAAVEHTAGHVLSCKTTIQYSAIGTITARTTVVIKVS